ncbi:structural maintenance of chromosomes protein 4 [Lasius niger]|uniref:Structural maintenance of chromosomes protein 4 n=1 Tax=Lasius niger TaxID=67767 RepID=A0A0J7K4B5_LASNI|nr:structural maintenance of chromosomes protein 4 [Lasius niger]
MDDVNINEICVHVEEVKVIADGDEWIKLNWMDKQSGDNETSQSLDIQKEDSNTETSQTKDNDSKVSSINTESEDISDGISVITESDTDVHPVTNILQICRFNVGIIIGFILSYSFIAPEANSNSNGINTESLETVSRFQ